MPQDGERQLFAGFCIGFRVLLPEYNQAGFLPFSHFHTPLARLVECDPIVRGVTLDPRGHGQQEDVDAAIAIAGGERFWPAVAGSPSHDRMPPRRQIAPLDEIEDFVGDLLVDVAFRFVCCHNGRESAPIWRAMSSTFCYALDVPRKTPLRIA